MAEGGIGGSDESFISFAFAIVSVIMIIIYLPWSIRLIHGIFSFYLRPMKHPRDERINPLAELRESVCYIPQVMAAVTRDPTMIVAGAKIFLAEKVFFLRCCMPKFLKFVVRPKILVLWLWVVLFSSVMYQSLTFDPHLILGVSRTASTSEVKKAYRSLSKMYHPDQNKTEGAKDLYLLIRKAYKALVDREAFEEEEAQNVADFSVGVALPRFLTSREHDGLVLFGLLGLLVALPLYVWYKFNSDTTIPHLVWRIRFDKERVEHFMKHFGVPEDPKFVERRDSRRIILDILIELKLVPSNVRESVTANFPLLPDFVMRFVEAEKHLQSLHALGFDSSAIAELNRYMLKNGQKLIENFVAVHPNKEEEPHMEMMSPAAYRATKYLFEQHTQQVDEALKQLLTAFGGNLPTARRLLNLHAEMYELLQMAHQEKPQKHVVMKLMAMPQRITDVIDAMEPEIETTYKRNYKNYITQQVTDKRQKRLVKNHLKKL